MSTFPSPLNHEGTFVPGADSPAKAAPAAASASGGGHSRAANRLVLASVFPEALPRRSTGSAVSPFSRNRSLSQALDDAFQRFYTNPFEEWLGGLLGRFRR